MYYLNDFPEPFVEHGEADFAIIVGEDSRHFFLGSSSAPPVICERKDMKFADVTDAFGLIEIACCIGRRLPLSVSPGPCIFSSSLVRVDRQVEKEVLKRHLILVGSGKINIVFEEYEEKCKNQLRVAFKYGDDGSPVALQSGGREMYPEEYFRNVGFVQIAKNPDNKGKAILFLAGYHGSGTYAACIALTRKLEEIKGNDDVVACIVRAAQSGKLGRFLDDMEILDVITAIETIDDIEMEHKRRLLSIYKENVRLLEIKIAKYGEDVKTAHEIQGYKEKIIELEEELARK